MNHRSPPYATLVAAILLCLRAATVAGGELGLASVTQGPADLTIPADVPAGEAQRYGLGFPFQVGPTTAALWVNLRQEGTGVGDFEKYIVRGLLILFAVLFNTIQIQSLQKARVAK